MANNLSSTDNEDMRGESTNPAAELIRRKLAAIYGQEPSAKEEVKEVRQGLPKPRTIDQSKHQQFMYGLMGSGKPLADIQTAWHDYYTNLPDKEKLEVWDEFYKAHGRTPQFFQKVADQVHLAQRPPLPVGGLNPSFPRHRHYHPPEPAKVIVAEHVLTPPKHSDHRRLSSVRQELINRVSANGQLKAKHHLKSLGFGLGLGAIVIIIFLFGFFNEVIIAPFIQPSRNVSSTPIILSSSALSSISSTPEVIIPKINVQIPVDYSETSTNESVIENDLEGGVVHYPSTVLPGQLGNTAYFGHSSNNIFNPGKYKFAFVLLHTLVPGDTFYLAYNNTVYVYQVYQTKIVPPTDVSVLDNVPGKAATAALITCDPPGTSINRLVVWGQQISPNPTADIASAAPTTTGPAPTVLPSNGPSLWSRFIHALF